MRYAVTLLLEGFLAAACCGFASNAVALEPGQLPPIRLYSIGDSLTRANNANLPGDNLNNSWVNGYYGFTQRLFGLPNINAHHQRITEFFGSSDRRNWTAAQNGARMDDMLSQATPVALLGVTYATVMLGANDVCRDTPAELPTDAEFEAHFRDGLTVLLDGLPNGATVLVAAIPNVRAVYDLGQTKTALGITSCPRIWKITDFCPAMLSRHRTELDRQYVRSRNVGYNTILQRVTAEMAAVSPGKFIRFSSATSELPTAEEQLSDLDCFHASWRGQREVSEVTWPF